MVSSVGKVSDTYSLFQAGGVARAKSSGSSDSIASTPSTEPSFVGKDRATNAISSILDNSQTQVSSGDYASAFQRLSSSLQALMVQLQGNTSVTPTTASQAAATQDTSTQDSVAQDSTSTTSSATSAQGSDVNATTAANAISTSASMAGSGVDQTYAASLRHTGGDRALQGDFNALIDDLHGYIQVANGDASTGTYASATTSTANDNATAASPAATAVIAQTEQASSSSPTASNSAVSASATTSDQAATSALNDVTYKFAQNLAQAMQSYNATGTNATAPQRSEVISAVG
jgi:hypothetical protein